MFKAMAAVAGVAIGSPMLAATAAPNMVNTTWVDYDCVDAFEFYDGVFYEYDVFDEFYGRWRLDGDTLILQYDDGNVVSTVVSADSFTLQFSPEGGESYICEFRLV